MSAGFVVFGGLAVFGGTFGKLDSTRLVARHYHKADVSNLSHRIELSLTVKSGDAEEQVYTQAGMDPRECNCSGGHL